MCNKGGGSCGIVEAEEHISVSQTKLLLLLLTKYHMQLCSLSGILLLDLAKSLKLNRYCYRVTCQISDTIMFNIQLWILVCIDPNLQP